MITFKIDEIVPCLKENETGDIYDTEVIRIKRKSILEKYNKKTDGMLIGVNFPKERKCMLWF